MQDKAGFEKTLAALYDRSSPTFHHWLTDAELKKFAPTEAQRDAVRQTLQASGLTVLSTDRNGFSIRARGTAVNVARAFNTEIHDFVRNGETFRRTITPAALNGSAAAYVDVVAGLESHPVHPMLTRAKNLKTGAALANIPLKVARSAGGFSGYVTDQSLSPPQSLTLTGPGKHPETATYTGILYGISETLFPDFAPRDLESVYGLRQAYKQGLDGTGQTIVLLEGYGYPTVQSDANAEFQLAHLTPLSDTNFSIVYPEGQPAPDAGILAGWDIEIALDVQSSHSIAPGANVVIVATNGQDSEDFQYSMQYIIDNNIGSTVSDSWEEDLDLIAGPAEQESFEYVLELGAAKGISFQFSTGDSGDNGVGSPLGAPGVPAVAPHATAVGGTSILNTVGGTSFKPVSWGSAFSLVGDPYPLTPPFAYFYAGGGGGQSIYWPKPIWQRALPGLGRQTPDVSALADPYTGFPIVVTSGSKQYLEPGWGGTSLASPIFTAFWAIAQQAAGGALGQASPTLARLKTGLVDVVPLGNVNDVTGVVTDRHKETDYSTLDIFSGVVEQNAVFVGAIYFDEFSEIGSTIGFGLDTSLTTGTGWDNATGYGTPDGLNFIKAVAASAKP
jgi:subtilase family serine protease